MRTSTITPVALATLLFFGSTAFSAVADVSLEVVNDSGMALMGLHASPPGEEAWGRDLMRVHVLPDGETGHYVVEADAGQCEFDLRAVLEDGSRRNGVVDVCALPIHRIEGAR